ncbi:MAG: hypothetical protein ACTSVS_11180 [Candidatus Heimdallarchaeota archaeon]
MISKIRPFREDNNSSEKLVGKPIVDPKGDIIATCAEVFEDEKKKKHMRLSVKTEIGTDFIVEETIPVSAISKIGEVILLKKTFNIKPIPVEEIVTFEIQEVKTPKEKTIPPSEEREKDTQQKSQAEQGTDKTIEKQPPEATKATPLPKQKEPEVIQTEPKEESKKTTQRTTVKILLEELLTLEDPTQKQTLKEQLVKKIKKSKTNQKTILKGIVRYLASPELPTRLEMAELLTKIVRQEYEIVIPYFSELLTAAYNEPDKKIESVLCNSLTRVAIEANSKLVTPKMEKFFNDLIINHKLCKTISFSRIHNLNLKIFVNNYDMQTLIVSKYIKQIFVKKSGNDYADALKDFNAVIIANSLIRFFSPEKWQPFINLPAVKKTFDEHFIATINTILTSFVEGNIKTLTDIIKPKLGTDLSKKIVQNMIKTRIDDFLTNISIIPLDVMTSFFQDDNNMTVQILYDLINKNEINAQIIFIEEKTYIATSEHI